MVHNRDERGGIAITMVVAMVATMLTAAILVTIFRDLRVTRRAGDSASALQIADAGVNDAVKAVGTASGTAGACPAYATLPGFTRTDSIAGGTYTYCAAKEIDSLGRETWHIDATGVDKSGVKRRLRADALAEPLFPNAIQVLATAAFSSGFTVDSYKDELNRCTGKGKVGTNDAANFTFGTSGGGVGVTNCKNTPVGTWPYPPDGCVAYSDDGLASIPASQQGSGKCPPANTTRESPIFSVPVPQPPSTWDEGGPAAAPFVCDDDDLEAGKVYYFNSVTLAEGCRIETSSLSPYPAMAKPVVIYTSNLTIAGDNGAGLNPVNEPPNDATVCGSTHGQPGADRLYCPGWVGALQVNVFSGGNVSFTGNHGTFWGTINAPAATASWGGGSPSWEIFGSMIAKSINSGGGGGGGGVQAKWHYDETLGSLNTGRHFLKFWREEPQK